MTLVYIDVLLDFYHILCMWRTRTKRRIIIDLATLTVLLVSQVKTIAMHNIVTI